MSHLGATKTRNVDKCILLATALAKALAADGTRHSVRLLLDSGSQSSFITEACIQRLRLSRTRAEIPIIGLGSVHAGRTRGLATVQLNSIHNNDFNVVLNLLILDRITSRIPCVITGRQEIENFVDFPLADPIMNLLRSTFWLAQILTVKCW